MSDNERQEMMFDSDRVSFTIDTEMKYKNSEIREGDDIASWIDRVLQSNPGLSTRELSRQADLDETVVSAYRNGRKPSAESCIALAHAIGVPVTDVLMIARYLTYRPREIDSRLGRMVVEDSDFAYIATVWETLDPLDREMFAQIFRRMFPSAP